MRDAIRVALPKGRLMDRALAHFVKAGLLPSVPEDAGRRLTIRIDDTIDTIGAPIELLLLKNADVPTYVEHGIAAIGVCGTDVLDEAESEVLRLWTFPFGHCRLAIAGREGADLRALRSGHTMRVATKYTRMSASWFAAHDWSVELIALNGSVELGAVLGLADVIVDLVETGSTLRENHLVVLETIADVRSKLVANRTLPSGTLASVARLVDALERTGNGGGNG